MKIGIDATFNLHGGSLGHLQGFLENLTISNKKSELILYLNPNNLSLMDKKIIEKCNLKIILLSSYGNFFRIIWSQLVLPFIVKIHKIDVLFCPGNFSPILKTTRVKSQWIATIGPFCKDLYLESSLLTKISLYLNKYFILLSANTSNVVIHQAEYSKKLFENKYNFKSFNQFLIQCGKDEFYSPDTSKVKSLNILSDISSIDLLYVSHIFPYKNVIRLINAYAKYKKNKNINPKLYIVGKIMDLEYFKKIKKIININKLENDIIFTGIVSKKELKFAYSKCKLFVFPSLCESSGYTLIEAMSCGAPILASDKTAIPFTCRNAAVYFDAYNEDDLLLNLRDILSDEKKLKSMKISSLDRSLEIMNYKTATNIFLNIIKSYF